MVVYCEPEEIHLKRRAYFLRAIMPSKSKIQNYFKKKNQKPKRNQTYRC